MLTNGILSLLLAQTSITSIAGTRIQPIPAPEDLSQYPCATYQVASYSTGYANEGSIGVSETRIIFDCFAARYLDSRSLAQAIASALSGYTGTLPDGTRVFFAEIVNVVDGFDDGSRIYRTSVHCWVQYSE